MTEQEKYHEPAAPVNRREVYRESQVEVADLPADDTARDIYQERVSGPGGEQVVRSEHVSVPSDAARRAAGVARAKQVVYFIFGAIEALLALRFVLLALGANPASPFVGLIYGVSGPFAMPFQGIFGEPVLGASVIEWSSLVGIIVYALVAYAIARLIELVYAPARTSMIRER
jgi:hypothetical protein